MELTRRGAGPAAALAAGILVAGLLPEAPPAASAPPARGDLRRAVQMLMDLAALPSWSGDAEGVGRAADWLAGRFSELAIDTRVLEGEGSPLLLARRPAAPGAPSVLFYLHYDTQPTGPPEDWGSTGGLPFSPRLLSGRWDEPGVRSLSLDALDAASAREARLYARGAADDKAPIVMHLAALREWLAEPAASRLALSFLLDGEEESGSPHIAEALARHSALLRADLLILCDGPMDALGRRSVYLGARGDMHVRVHLRTASASGHSGNYGLLPDAAWRLAWLLSTLKDSSGRVAVEGFHDGIVPPTPAERSMMAEASLAEPAIAGRFGLERFEGDPDLPYFERLVFTPGLVINELAAGRPGNQVPNLATALLEVRLVTRQDPDHVFEAIRRHLQARMPGVEVEMLDATPASRIEAADPAVARAIEAAGRAAGAPVLVYPSLGGTLPLLEPFASAGHKYVGLPLVNFDNNQHVANENVRISALTEGIDFLVGLYRALAGP